VTDLGILSPDNCEEFAFCTLNWDSMQLLVDQSQFLTLNLIAKDPDWPLSAGVSYRLINTNEQFYLQQTLVLMCVGLCLLAGFIFLVFKAMTTPIEVAKD